MACFGITIFIFTIIALSNSALVVETESAISETERPVETCNSLCTGTFPPHTYPNGEDNNACTRGCRFYIIGQFLPNLSDRANTIDDSDLSPSPLKLHCYNSCVEAYNETSQSSISCKTGCDNQETLSQKDKVANLQDESEGFHILKPVMQIKEVVSKIVDSIEFVKYSITYLFISDNNKLIAVEGPSHIMVNIIDEDETVNNENTILPFIENEQESSVSERSMFPSSASIENLSVRVGIPPYLLIISLISFLIVLTYIILVLCSSSKKKEKKLKEGMQIPAHALPVKLVRPEDLTKLSLVDEEEGSLVPGIHQQNVKLPDNTKV